MNLSQRSLSAAIFLVAMVAGGCGARRGHDQQLTRLLSPLDGIYRLRNATAVAVSPSMQTGLTSVYRGGFGRVLYSDCEMLPSDSRFYDAVSDRCGPVEAVYRTSARMLLESEASAEFLPSTMSRGKIRWLDIPPSCGDGKPLRFDLVPPSATAPAVSSPEPTCSESQLHRCQQLVTHVRGLLQSGHAFEAHITATAAATVCECEVERLQFWDSMALHSLDDATTAQAGWRRLMQSPEAQTVAADARLALSWSMFRNNDIEAAQQVAAALPAPTLQRLHLWQSRNDSASFRNAVSVLPDATMQREASLLQSRLIDARHSKRPWLAASLSAFIPGAGQLYAGSYQGAALSFVLNSVLIATTVEFARRDMYIAATTSGLVASVFYVGGILNASDLADRRTKRAASVPERALTTLLLPELTP
jgi:hypothetical protein